MVSMTYLSPVEAKKYTYFSRFTKGESGRHVKIHPNLLLPFLSAVNPNTHEGELIIHQIENLKKTAAILNNSRNASNAFDHMIKIKNLQVYYRVESACVYITNLKVIHKGDQEAAGLYNIFKSIGAGKIQAKKLKNNKLPTLLDPKEAHTIYINGAVPRFSEAVDATQKEHSLVKPLALFYNPAHVINELGVWKSNLLSNRDGNTTASKLADIIKSHQKTSRKIYWSVEGEGAALLAEALKSVTGKLGNQHFRLINPVAQTPALLNSLKDKEAKLPDEPISFSKDGNRSAYIALMSHKSKLLETIDNLPVKNDDQKFERSLLTNDIKAMGKGFSDSTKPSINKTFIDLVRQAGKLV